MRSLLRDGFCRKLNNVRPKEMEAASACYERMLYVEPDNPLCNKQIKADTRPLSSGEKESNETANPYGHRNDKE